MIEFNRNYQLAPSQAETVQIKIVGIGGAGSNALDRIMLDGIESAGLVALNTDVQALTSSVATEKVQLGRETTRGLGTGGDPEVGLEAAEEAVDEIRRAIDGARMVFIIAGLGGGTGSGAAPFVANIAKEQGALVVAFATLPFRFEGKRRGKQAEESLALLQEAADVVVCFENDKMGDAVSPKAGIHQAFAAADQTISQSVKAMTGIFTRDGLLHIGFDDLTAALSGCGARCVFGFGEADGDNRAHEALALALKNPLMDRGRMLSDVSNVLVNIAGGPGMTLNEVQILMEEFGKHVGDEARILFGASVDAKMGNRMSVTILSSTGSEVARVRHTPRVSEFVQPSPCQELEQLIAESQEAVESVEAVEAVSSEEEYEMPVQKEAEAIVAEEPPAPPVVEPKPAITRTPRIIPSPAPVATAKPVAEPRQETLQFEPVTRGRFEKSEPTIVDGQDLDVPTFMRRNIKLK